MTKLLPGKNIDFFHKNAQIKSETKLVVIVT